MRTTLTLDDDLAEALKARSVRTGLPFRTVLNAAVRLGLEAELAPPPARVFRLEPVSLGQPRAGWDLTKALQVADEIQDSAGTLELGRRKGSRK